MPLRMSELASPNVYGVEELMQSPAQGFWGSASDHYQVGAVSIPAGKEHGLELLHSASENRVIVCGVPSGPWLAWNEAHPRHTVDVCDEIIEVNRKRGDYAIILNELSSKSSRSKMVTMSIRRPTEHRILVDKREGETLGLGFATLGNDALFIDAILENGVISGWNAKNPLRRVRMLDRIVEVNNCRGSAKQLVDLLQLGTDFEIVLQTHLDHLEV